MSQIGMSRRKSRAWYAAVALVVLLVLACILFSVLQGAQGNSAADNPATSTSSSASGATSASSAGTQTYSADPALASAGLEVIKTQGFNVYDGDTFHVMVNGKDEKVRLMGIDTPEMDATLAADKARAVAARDYTAGLVDGKTVYLVCETATFRDKYDRILAYVWLAEPPSSLEQARGEVKDTLNGVLLTNGHATTMFYGKPVFQAELQACYDARIGGGAGQASSGSQASGSGAASVPSASKGPNGEYYIKGNISSTTGEKIYHMPGQQYYDATVIDESKGERWFRSEEEAQAAGWRKSRV